MKDIINRPEKPKKEDLIKVYDICNKIFKDKKCFYENEKQLEKDKEKI